MVLTNILSEGRRVCNQDILTQSYCCQLCKLRCDFFLADLFEVYKNSRNTLLVDKGKLDVNYI